MSVYAECCEISNREHYANSSFPIMDSRHYSRPPLTGLYHAHPITPRVLKLCLKNQSCDILFRSHQITKSHSGGVTLELHWQCHQSSRVLQNRRRYRQGGSIGCTSTRGKRGDRTSSVFRVLVLDGPQDALSRDSLHLAKSHNSTLLSPSEQDQL